MFPSRACVCLIVACLLFGCGGKGTTKFSYSTPDILPLNIRFGVDTKGSWSVQTGVATPVGTFTIAQAFSTRDDFSYVILRNRNRGTDQVFKLGVTGHVDVHAIGEHKLRIEKEENRWIIETDTISGQLTISVHPTSSAIARVDFGEQDPDFIVSTNRTVTVEYPSWFTSPTILHLDSVDEIALMRGPGTRVYFRRKPTVDISDFYIDINDTRCVSDNFDALESAILTVAPHIAFHRSTTLWPAGILLGIVVFFPCGIFACSKKWISARLFCYSLVGLLVSFVVAGAIPEVAAAARKATRKAAATSGRIIESAQ